MLPSTHLAPISQKRRVVVDVSDAPLVEEDEAMLLQVRILEMRRVLSARRGRKADEERKRNKVATMVAPQVALDANLMVRSIPALMFR